MLLSVPGGLPGSTSVESASRCCVLSSIFGASPAFPPRTAFVRIGGMPDAARFTTADLLATTTETWREFFRVDDLSLGIYTLEVGEIDEQSPHAEDEIYVVLEGAARLRAGDEDYDASAGAILYVKAQVEHRFHDITERLRLLVLFAPAETEAA